MEGIRHASWARRVAWVLMMAMTLPWVAGCATGPEARPPRLASIVVDGERVVREGEDAFVRVWREGRPIAVRAGMALRQGDRVSTGERAEAVIRYPNGTELLMRPRSSGQIGSITGAIGEFFAKVWGVFSIETEYVKAGARGTAFHVRAAPDGRAEVWVINGSVEVSSRLKAWRPLLLTAGTGAVAQLEAPSPRRLTDAEVAETQAWVERIDRLVPAEPAGSAAGAAAAALAIGAMAAILMGSRDGQATGGDRPERRPQATPPLPAPIRLRPGSVDAQRAPQLNCRSPVTLAWDRVAGARDYVVTLQALPPRMRDWQTIATRVTDAPRAFTPAGIGARLRWWVQARDERGPGPSSATLYFHCTTSVVR